MNTSRDTPLNLQSRSGLADDTSASYTAYNNVPMGATHFRGRLFVTMPRRRTGIPSTLNYIDMRRDGSQTSPKLHAYPNFELNQFNASESTIVSVYRTTVDPCQRLWFIDTGMLEYPSEPPVSATVVIPIDSLFILQIIASKSDDPAFGLWILKQIVSSSVSRYLRV